MQVDVVTIFPDYLAPLELSLIGRARRTGLLRLRVHDLRDFTHDRHRTVDDTPAGGGPGMVMRPEPWGEALDHVLASGPEPGAAPVLVVPAPSGQPFTQVMAQELAAEPWLVFACGRYEGIDERVVLDASRRIRVRQVSLGDYVLNGGEVAVLAVVEAVARLLPGVLGNQDSLVEESHQDGLLEYPVYTKPTSWRDLEIPEVLVSGHHARVQRWRRDERLRRTARRRPDLLAALGPDTLDARDRQVLVEEGWSVDADAVRPAGQEPPGTPAGQEPPGTPAGQEPPGTPAGLCSDVQG
jgi:tRNA (guanine37-N1)-methyltransferase